MIFSLYVGRSKSLYFGSFELNARALTETRSPLLRAAKRDRRQANEDRLMVEVCDAQSSSARGPSDVTIDWWWDTCYLTEDRWAGSHTRRQRHCKLIHKHHGYEYKYNQCLLSLAPQIDSYCTSFLPVQAHVARTIEVLVPASAFQIRASLLLQSLSFQVVEPSSYRVTLAYCCWCAFTKQLESHLAVDPECTGVR